MKKASSVVLFNDQGQILAVSRKTDHTNFALIGGKMDPEDMDDPEVTAIREAKEETGLDIFNLRLLHTSFWDGYQQFTYLADWKGDIHTDEPHVVKWSNFDLIINGTFGEYNKEISTLLKERGIEFVM